MKTRKTDEPAATPPAKAKLKIKSLKLTKQTIENLSSGQARAVKGGRVGRTSSELTNMTC